MYVYSLSHTHMRTHKDNLSISNITMNVKSLHNFIIFLTSQKLDIVKENSQIGKLICILLPNCSKFKKCQDKMIPSEKLTVHHQVKHTIQYMQKKRGTAYNVSLHNYTYAYIHAYIGIHIRVNMHIHEKYIYTHF